MKDVNTILNTVRVRPPLYLGKPSITRLRLLIQGYAWGVEDCNGSEDISTTTYQFTWHLTHKYRFLKSRDWCGILLSLKNNNEEEALALLWEEWDEFISKTCTCPQEILTRQLDGEYDWGNYIWCYCGRPEESLTVK